MDYVLEVFTQAVASTDPCRTAFSVLVPLLLSIVLGTLFVPRVLLLSRKRKLYDIPDQRKVHNRQTDTSFGRCDLLPGAFDQFLSDRRPVDAVGAL